MNSESQLGLNHLQLDFNDFFEEGLCGYLIADNKGVILKSNKKIASWLNLTPEEIQGKRFADLLSVGCKIYHETHLKPLLRFQGFFDEVVLELYTSKSEKLQVLVNAFERRDESNNPHFIRYTILKGTDRLQYEKNLLTAKKLAEKKLENEKETVLLREQLIAVLGHDLRNPLSAINMAAGLLEAPAESEDAEILEILKRSASRMTELVDNIMDFARSRLGQDLVIDVKEVQIQSHLLQVINEIKLVHPEKEIISNINFSKKVKCDSDRIAQLVSNLLANALTHGAANSPVRILAVENNNKLEISITNNGKPIAKEVNKQIFTPFSRSSGSSKKDGLGLGLYICSEIAKAHNGNLSFVSEENETTFTFSMNI